MRSHIGHTWKSLLIDDREAAVVVVHVLIGLPSTMRLRFTMPDKIGLNRDCVGVDLKRYQLRQPIGGRSPSPLSIPATDERRSAATERRKSIFYKRLGAEIKASCGCLLYIY